MKRKRLIYLTMPLIVAIVAGVLMWMTSVQDMLPVEGVSPNTHYIVSVCACLLLIASCYVAMHRKCLPLQVRTALLVVAALSIVLLYYVFGDANLVYALPLLAVAYLYLWPREYSETE